MRCRYHQLTPQVSPNQDDRLIPFYGNQEVVLTNRYSDYCPILNSKNIFTIVSIVMLICSRSHPPLPSFASLQNVQDSPGHWMMFVFVILALILHRHVLSH